MFQELKEISLKKKNWNLSKNKCKISVLVYDNIKRKKNCLNSLLSTTKKKFKKIQKNKFLRYL